MDPATFVANVEWHSTPLRKATQNVKLLRVDPYKPLSGWWVSRQLVRILTHWDGHKGWPHLADKKACPGCRNGLGMREKGYGLLLAELTAKIGVAELTQGCMDEDHFFSTPGIVLRGRYCTLSRRRPANGKNPRSNSPLDCTWGPKPAPKDMREEWDFRPSLGLIFQLIPSMHGVTAEAEWKGGDR